MSNSKNISEFFGSEPGLSGVHVSVRPGSERSPVSLSERDAVEENPGAERTQLSEMTNAEQSHTPLPQLIEGLNRHLKGWANYLAYGYARPAFYRIDSYVRWRLTRHLRRRSQRPFALPRPAGRLRTRFSFWGLLSLYGLIWPADGTPCACLRRESLREPDAVDLHVRFDEWRGAYFLLPLLLYRLLRGCTKKPQPLANRAALFADEQDFSSSRQAGHGTATS